MRLPLIPALAAWAVTLAPAPVNVVEVGRSDVADPTASLAMTRRAVRAARTGAVTLRTTAYDMPQTPVEVERFNARYARTGTPAVTDPYWTGWRREQSAALVRRVSVFVRQARPSAALNAEVPAGGEAEAQNWLREGIVDRAFVRENAEATPRELTPETRPAPAATTGTLCGTVLVGERLTPADAASVEIRPAKKVATALYRVTDGGGLFAAVRLVPGDYVVRATFGGEASAPRRVTVVAGETAACDFLLSAGDLPEPRSVTGISAVKPGSRVLFQARRVSSAGVPGTCHVSDGLGAPPVLVRLPKDATAEPGEVVTLTGVVGREAGRTVIAADAVRVVGVVRPDFR